MSHTAYVEKWRELFALSDSMNIAVGYASNDSLLYLRKLVELNSPKEVNLCLGMARFEGLFESQLSAAIELNDYLRGAGCGQVFVSSQFPFHGKVQTFSRGRELVAGFVGSSNLSNIVPPEGLTRGNYEVDLLVDESAAILDLDRFIGLLFKDASTPLEEFDDLKTRKDSNLWMEELFEVEKIPEPSLREILRSREQIAFDIPIKTAGKSNLNAYFGKGRGNRQGFVKPRHWYEAEIIVDKAVQESAPHYPRNEQFIAYTDDGYRFALMAGGDNGKNLRSRDDLTILGRWLKGRMELCGALTSGKPVTDEVLNKYGRDSMTLTKTRRTEFDQVSGRDLAVWTLDFDPRA